jgi:hypothetical protein
MIDNLVEERTGVEEKDCRVVEICYDILLQEREAVIP